MQQVTESKIQNENDLNEFQEIKERMIICEEIFHLRRSDQCVFQACSNNKYMKIG